MRSVLSQFIQNELDAYATTQRLCGDSIIPFIVKAFEAYDEYKRLVHPLDSLPKDRYQVPPGIYGQDI